MSWGYPAWPDGFRDTDPPPAVYRARHGMSAGSSLPAASSLALRQRIVARVAAYRSLVQPGFYPRGPRHRASR